MDQHTGRRLDDIRLRATPSRSAAQYEPGFFSNAHDFGINDSYLYDFSYTVHCHGSCREKTSEDHPHHVFYHCSDPVFQVFNIFDSSYHRMHFMTP